MSFVIKDYEVGPIEPHPTLRALRRAEVAVTISETRDGASTDQVVRIRVMERVAAGMGEAEIRAAIIAKAASIIKRTLTAVESAPALAAE
jgi:cytochrome c553